MSYFHTCENLHYSFLDPFSLKWFFSDTPLIPFFFFFGTFEIKKNKINSDPAEKKLMSVKLKLMSETYV